MPEALATEHPLPAATSERAIGPSSLYRGSLWKFALASARTLPRPLAILTAKFAMNAYRIASPHRRKIVFENLLPIFANDQSAARAATNRLFSRFATKMVDLL